MRAASYCDVTNGRFHHHNGVASLGVSAWRLIVMIVVGFIFVYCFVFVVEYKLTTHTVCAVVVCAATPGTALVGPPAGAAASGRATAGSTRAVPGVAAQTTPTQTASWSIPITHDPSHATCTTACPLVFHLFFLNGDFLNFDSNFSRVCR